MILRTFAVRVVQAGRGESRWLTEALRGRLKRPAPNAPLVGADPV
jgi:hypothetical protein